MSRFLVVFLAVIGVFFLTMKSAKAEYILVYQQPQPTYYVPITIQSQNYYTLNPNGTVTLNSKLSATLSVNDGYGTRTITAFNNQSVTPRPDGVDRKKEEG
jgi:hypothetical protein